MAQFDVILTGDAPVPTSGYSQALRQGNLLVTSGYLGTAPDGSGSGERRIRRRKRDKRWTISER